MAATAVLRLKTIVCSARRTAPPGKFFNDPEPEKRDADQRQNPENDQQRTHPCCENRKNRRRQPGSFPAPWGRQTLFQNIQHPKRKNAPEDTTPWTYKMPFLEHFVHNDTKPGKSGNCCDMSYEGLHAHSIPPRLALAMGGGDPIASTIDRGEPRSPVGTFIPALVARRQHR